MRTLILAGASLLALLASVDAAMAAPVTFTYTGGFQTYVAPVTGLYDIVAYGAQGGVSFESGGLGGAEIGGDVTLTQGEILTIAVGGAGQGVSGYGGGSGGGGSFVVAGTIPIMIAGGGAGGGNGGYQTAGSSGTAGQIGSGEFSILNGNPGGINGSGGGTAPSYMSYGGGGGGGFLSDGLGSATGGAGGASFFDGLAGGAGSPSFPAGGFGGGGGGSGGGGGGGGYSGGGGGDDGGGGGGGGSFNAGLNNSDLLLVSGENAGNGLVTINLVSPTAVPEPASMALLGIGLLGMLAVHRRRQS